MSWVSLTEIKFHLRYEDEASDALLLLYADAAHKAIASYITETITEDMLPVLKTAQLLLIGYLDDNRNSERGETLGNYLPAPVRQLLSPYRLLSV